MTNKLNQLKEIIKTYGKAAVAFSGGVDSTFLLKICMDVLGKENVVAVTASSETYTLTEVEFARSMASGLNANHIIFETDELSDKNFLSNGKDRCYFCKKNFYSKLIRIAGSENILYVIDGANSDDNKDYRPGIKAAFELGIKSPLMEAGFTKENIRRFSKEMGLCTWDKPANPCLASRLPYGSTITREKLLMVAQAEDFIRSLGFRITRVRHHDKIARVEVSSSEIARFCQDDIRNKVVKRLKEMGFTWVAIDLEGYRMGSLNAEIK
jgi:pyridinium-3,5-biscarboxylic acid mononucleotide sulfurtransferase